MVDSCLGYWHVIKRVLQYLEEIIPFGLKYSFDVE